MCLNILEPLGKEKNLIHAIQLLNGRYYYVTYAWRKGFDMYIMSVSQTVQAIGLITDLTLNSGVLYCT